MALAFLTPIAQMLMIAFTNVRFLSRSYYLGILWHTGCLSLTIIVISALIGFPFGYIVWQISPSLRLWLVIMAILPLIASVMVLFSRNVPVSGFLSTIRTVILPLPLLG